MLSKTIDQNQVSETDQLVGANVKRCREAKCVSQETIARAINVPVADFERCELGLIRLRAEQLFEISKHLDEPLASFYAE